MITMSSYNYVLFLKYNTGTATHIGNHDMDKNMAIIQTKLLSSTITLKEERWSLKLHA